jgi:hypothetical protein
VVLFILLAKERELTAHSTQCGVKLLAMGRTRRRFMRKRDLALSPREDTQNEAALAQARGKPRQRWRQCTTMIGIFKTCANNDASARKVHQIKRGQRWDRGKSSDLGATADERREKVGRKKE